MDKDFYITTAIPYVNAAPHLGHVLEFIQTDVIARYQRLKGRKAELVTGADENSLKNVHAAEKKGITVAQLCQMNSAIFKEIADKAGLSYTAFRRTSDQKTHWPGVMEVWRLCEISGDIYSKKYRGLYCVGCEAFYEEDELLDGICPEHRTKPEVVEEQNYFFRLSKYQQELLRVIENDELKIVPQTRKNEVLSFIRSGLKDFSISRSVSRAKGWGVPVPNDPDQIMYVWFDALGTYITGVGYGTDKEAFERAWPADVHVIGKGILRFHAVYWPAMLLSAGLKLPKTIFVHGYITVEGQKMSKSLGNIIDPKILIERYGLDPLRYFLLSEVPTFEDGDFSEKALMDTNNNELLANLGNLVNRTLVFLKNNFDGKVPAWEPNGHDQKFLLEQQEIVAQIETDLDALKLKEALHKTMGFSKNTNRYFQDHKPWELVKKDKIRAGPVLSILVSQVKDIAVLIGPFLPGTSVEMMRQLGVDSLGWNDIGKPLSEGHKIGEPKTIFKKIEPKKTEELPKEATPSFADIDLEVGEILSIEKHPNAEKLFVEKVRLSDGVRQIVSGLAEYYYPEELLGKKVVILKNLAPAKLRGVESQGMLLAADGREYAIPRSGHGAPLEHGAVEVIFCASSKVGEKVLRKGEKNTPKNLITISEFSKIKIEVKDFFVVCEGKPLATSGEDLRMKNVKEGEVG